MKGTATLRDRLMQLLEEVSPDPSFCPVSGESLIVSGRIDSLGLFHLALWIEKETRTRLDLTTLDPSKDWDTVEDILEYVAKHGATG